jgi:hypothetical protein
METTRYRAIQTSAPAYGGALNPAARRLER